VSNQNRRNLFHRITGIRLRGADSRKRWPILAGVVVTALIIGTASTAGIANANGSPSNTSQLINRENSNISYSKKLAHKDASRRSSVVGASAKPATKGPRRKAPKRRQRPGAAVKTTRKTSASSTLSQRSGFVEGNGISLTLNGQPYKFVGINIYMAASVVTPASCDGDSYPPLNLNAILSDMPKGIVFRFWAFQDFFVSNGSLNWTSFDHVLAIAAAHGDKVIPVLADQYSYCDGAAKDLAWYQSGYETTVEPGDVVPYGQYVSDVVSRYAKNPTIAVWQLVNEGEAVNSDGSCNESAALAALLAFSNNVGGLIHSLDPSNLVSLGTLAGYSGSGTQWCGAANGDYQTLMASSGNDVCDFHDYGYPKDPMGMPFGPDLATAIEMCHANDKPLMVGETGIMADATDGLATRAAKFTAKFSAQFRAGVVGELMWTWANSPDYVSPVQDSAFPDYGVFPGDPALGVFKSFLKSSK
jgi:mannan endo-1,4-beta-mannosidase